MSKSKRDKTFSNKLAEIGSAIGDLTSEDNKTKEEDNLNEKLSKSLEEITESAKVKNQIEAIAKLNNKDESSRNNVLLELKEAGLPISDLLGANQDQVEKMSKILDRERKRRLESEEKAIEVQRENKSNEMNLVMEIMKMQMQNQEKQTENMKDILKELKDEIKEVKTKDNNDNQNKAKDDPISKAASKLVDKALEEKLEDNQVDPFEQIAFSKKRLNQLQELFGVGMNDIDKNKLELEHQLELKRMELEDERRRRDQERKREFENKKLQKWDSFMANIQQIIPHIAQSMSNNNQNNNQSKTNNNNDDEFGGVICNECGQEMIGRSVEEIPDNCINCGTALFESDKDE